jgi:hypothetical protein
MGRNVNEDALRVEVKVGVLVAGGVFVCVGVLVGGELTVLVAVGVRVGVLVGGETIVLVAVGVNVVVGGIKLGVMSTGVAVAGEKFIGRLIASTSLPARPQTLPSKYRVGR